MSKSRQFRAHGAVRGVNLSRSSRMFEGPFGRIFRALPPADFGPDDQSSLKALDVLATKMTADIDPPKDGPDAEESGIPAAYTYLGQFIDHDLTFDPASSLQKQNDPDALVDFRTPRFDLDSVYGRGPDDQPYLYEDGHTFLLGRALSGAAANPRARDLPRNHPNSASHPKRAIIGDPRNDENIIVSQMQGLFLRFHNKGQVLFLCMVQSFQQVIEQLILACRTDLRAFLLHLQIVLRNIRKLSQEHLYFCLHYLQDLLFLLNR